MYTRGPQAFAGRSPGPPAHQGPACFCSRPCSRSPAGVWDKAGAAEAPAGQTGPTLHTAPLVRPSAAVSPRGFVNAWRDTSQVKADYLKGGLY